MAEISLFSTPWAMQPRQRVVRVAELRGASLRLRHLRGVEYVREVGLAEVADVGDVACGSALAANGGQNLKVGWGHGKVCSTEPPVGRVGPQEGKRRVGQGHRPLAGPRAEVVALPLNML